MKLENKLKEKLLNNKKVLGCWTNLDSEITSELLALVRFDFLLIDHEHGYGDVKGITRQVPVSYTHLTLPTNPEV